MMTRSIEIQQQARGRLHARAAELKERLARVERDLRRETTPLPRDAPDAAIVIENDEILTAIRDTGRKELAHISAALERLDHGLYGICETCGADIPEKRLAAVPYVVQCADCAE